LVAIFASAFLLSGCMAKGPVFTEAAPPRDRALIYIYRTPNYAMSADAAGFSINGSRIGTIAAGGYTYVYAAPGHYDIKQFWSYGVLTMMTPKMWDDLSMALDVKAGETHYIRMGTDMDGGAYTGATYHWRIAEVSPAQAQTEVEREKFEPQDKDLPAEFKP
jgi:hypothetical protein